MWFDATSTRLLILALRVSLCMFELECGKGGDLQIFAPWEEPRGNCGGPG